MMPRRPAGRIRRKSRKQPDTRLNGNSEEEKMGLTKRICDMFKIVKEICDG
jgi:hypothetical protein